MTHGSDKGDRKRRWKETEQEWHRYHVPAGKYLWDGEIDYSRYTKTIYRSLEQGVDTSVFRHHKSKERK